MDDDIRRAAEAKVAALRAERRKSEEAEEEAERRASEEAEQRQRKAELIKQESLKDIDDMRAAVLLEARQSNTVIRAFRRAAWRAKVLRAAKKLKKRQLAMSRSMVNIFGDSDAELAEIKAELVQSAARGADMSAPRRAYAVRR